ncbi:MAG TPA: helix-turn-helix transcriptional regulator [Tepidiformaceae bacterium]|nr:helix-turn-helix transcriptional regulator [Tepidiformaceae bacterium]
MVTRPAHYNTRYKFDLSPRQREVLDLIARGRTNPEIADTLGVSLDGAKYHVREILAKLDVESREEAAMFWRSYNRPMARLERALSGVFGLSTLKAVIGGAAVIGAGAAIAGVIVAINASGGGGDSSADPGVGDEATTTATATPQVTATPAPGTAVERFARDLDQVVSVQDVDALMAMAQPTSFDCPGGTPQGLGGPFPLCDAAAAGEVREGYRITRHGSEGEVVSPAAFRQQLASEVAGSKGLVTVGCPSVGGCESFAVAFDATPTVGGYYRAFYLSFITVNGEPVLRGLGMTGDNADAVVNGGVTRAMFGDDFSEVEFKPVS